MGLVVDFIGIVIKYAVMTGEAEECFQLPLQELSYTNPGTGWMSARMKEGRGHSKANSNFVNLKHRRGGNRQRDIFTKSVTFRKLIRDLKKMEH